MGTSTNGPHEPNSNGAVPSSVLERMPRAELFALARSRGVPNTMLLTREELVEEIERQQAPAIPTAPDPEAADQPEADGSGPVRPIDVPPDLPSRPPSPTRKAPAKGTSPVPGLVAAVTATALFLRRRRR